jgi:lipoate---protein ligase
MWIDDVIINRCEQQLVVHCWIPSSTCVVLGNANQAERECLTTACSQANVPILKRYGGGGTVVLYPGCVVVTVGTWVQDAFGNTRYGEMLNQALINVLQSALNSHTLCVQGLNDICYGNQKLGGTSLFRSKNYLLYQASLLGELDLKLIERLLQHPSKEPEYRAGRHHSEFLTSLTQLSQNSVPEFLSLLRNQLTHEIAQVLHSEMIEPQSEHFQRLRSRASSLVMPYSRQNT